MTAEIVDLGQYRKQKERDRKQTPKMTEDPPEPLVRENEASNQDDEMG